MVFASPVSLHLRASLIVAAMAWQDYHVTEEELATFIKSADALNK